MGKYQFKFRNVDKSSISNYAFDCRSHNNLNFYDPVSSSRDIGQNRGANLIWRAQYMMHWHKDKQYDCYPPNLTLILLEYHLPGFSV